MKNKIIIIMTLVLSVSIFLQGQSFNDRDTVRPVIEYKDEYKKGVIVFKFDLMENHHITDLKNDFFKIELNENDYLSVMGVTFHEGLEYSDEEVYKGKFEVIVYVKTIKNISNEKVELDFNVSYQICQEKPLEVCYPPESDKVKVTIAKNFIMTDSTADSGISLSLFSGKYFFLIDEINFSPPRREGHFSFSNIFTKFRSSATTIRFLYSDTRVTLFSEIIDNSNSLFIHSHSLDLVIYA